MNTPKLSFAGSSLQVTGKVTGSGKRQVRQALTRPYQFEPIGKLIVRIKLHMPEDVLDEIRKNKKEVEAITKLWNEALTGPLKGHVTDKARLDYAKEYFVTVVVRERFLPHVIDGTPSAAGTPINSGGHNAAIATATLPGPVASVADHPVVQVINEVMSGHMPTASIPASTINGGPSGLRVPPVGKVIEVPMQAPSKHVPAASQAAGPATTGLALIQNRRARIDPVLNIICHNCGNIHSQMTEIPIEEGVGLRGIEINNRTMMRTLVRKAWAWTPVVYILIAAGLAQLMKSYPKA